MLPISAQELSESGVQLRPSAISLPARAKARAGKTESFGKGGNALPSTANLGLDVLDVFVFAGSRHP